MGKDKPEEIRKTRRPKGKRIKKATPLEGNKQAVRTQVSQEGKKSRGFRPWHVTEKWKHRYQKDDHGESRINPDVKVWAVKRKQQRDKKKKEEKLKKMKERQDLLEQKKKALFRYKETKKQVHKKLATRNYKGQPNMASQMDILLQRIEEQRTHS